jgi:hypothetical protein
MLDLLHNAETSVFCGAGTWHGGCRFLAGGVDGKDGAGEDRDGEWLRIKDEG